MLSYIYSWFLSFFLSFELNFSYIPSLLGLQVALVLKFRQLIVYGRKIWSSTKSSNSLLTSALYGQMPYE